MLKSGRLGGGTVEKIILAPSGVVMIAVRASSGNTLHRIFLAPQGYGREMIK